MPEAQNGNWRLPRIFRSLTDSGHHKKSIDRRIRKQLESAKLWPSSLDQESWKAAVILRSDGLLLDEVTSPASPSLSQPAPRRIPAEIIRKAKGLIVCSILRAGLWENGAGGSGVAIARLPDGTWSYPAAIELSTAEIGVVVGVDIYDCVLVLNNQQSVDSLKNGRFFVGGDLYCVTGPLNLGWFLDNDERARTAPIFSYLGSQRYYSKAALDNTTVLAEREHENDVFYSPQKLTLRDILTGSVRSPPESIKWFTESLKLAEAEAIIDERWIPRELPPSDFKIVEEGHTFSVPDIDDPDPYGVLALEKQGLFVRDATTKRTASAEHFDFNPSITSPLHERYHRKLTGDTSSISGRSSWRASTLESKQIHFLQCLQVGGDRGDDRASTRSVRTRYSESPAPDSPGLISNGPFSPGLGSNTAYSPRLAKQFDNSDENVPRARTLDKQDSSQYSPNGLNIAETRFAPGDDESGLKFKRLSSNSIVRQTMIVEEEDDDTKVAIAPQKDESPQFKLSAPPLPLRKLVPIAGPQSVEADMDSSGAVQARSPTTQASENDSREEAQIETPISDEESSTDEFEDIDDDDVQVFEGTQAMTFGSATAMSVSQPKVVSVARAVTPALPKRNPVRLAQTSEESIELPNDLARASLDGSRDTEPALHAMVHGAQGNFGESKTRGVERENFDSVKTSSTSDKLEDLGDTKDMDHVASTNISEASDDDVRAVGVGLFPEISPIDEHSVHFIPATDSLDSPTVTGEGQDHVVQGDTLLESQRPISSASTLSMRKTFGDAKDAQAENETPVSSTSIMSMRKTLDDELDAQETQTPVSITSMASKRRDLEESSPERSPER